MLNCATMQLRVAAFCLSILWLFPLSSALARAQEAPSKTDAAAIRDRQSKGDNQTSPPKVLYAPDPAYPPEARRAGHQGTCVVSFTVGTDGMAHDVKVMRGLDAALDEAAVAAVRTWRSEPAQKDGQPVVVDIKTEIKFRLHGPGNDKLAKLWDQADKSDPKADFELSKLYFEGRGVPQDERLGLQFLKMAADWNFPEAQFQMGERFYKNQHGVPDYVSAYMWYALSKRGGYKKSEGMLNVLAAKMSPDQLSQAETRVDYWPEDPPKQP